VNWCARLVRVATDYDVMDSRKHAVGTARSSRNVLAGLAAASAVLARQCWQQHVFIGLAASVM
jgi:hypothetical protein